MKRKYYFFILIIMLFVLSGCSREVVDRKVHITINEEEIQGLFTGTLDSSTDTGTGKITFKIDETISWSYEGDVSDGKLSSLGTVENYPYNMTIYEEEVTGNYSGELMDGSISGKGIFSIPEGWKYEGEFLNGEIYGEGKISDYPCTITFSDVSYSGSYSGDMENGIISGKGFFLADDGWSYEGNFNNCTFTGEGKAEKIPYTYTYETVDIAGEYTGEFVDALPEGEGTFSSTVEEIIFDYQGTWDDGKLSGEGILSTNHYTIEFTDVLRTGSYEGPVKDGLASGEGLFSAVTDDDEKYTYTGMFKEGTFNGYGKREFDKDLNYPVYEGTYTNGDFTPTKAEILTFFGNIPDFVDYDVSDESLEFINNHEDLFLSEDKDSFKEFYDKSVSVNELFKKPTQYPDTIVSIPKCRVTQIMEEYGFTDTVTWFICHDSNYNTIFVLASSELPNTNKNSQVRVYGLPIGLCTYENTLGAETSALVIYATYIE